MTSSPSDQSDLRRFIGESVWFEDAPAACLDTLAAAASLKHFDAGAHVWTIGERTTSLFGLVNGRIRLYQASEAGQEYALVEWEDGAWFGEQGLAMDEPNRLGVLVLEPSDIVVLPLAIVRKTGSDWPGLYRNLFSAGWRNTVGLYEIIESVVFYPLRARVAGRVLGLVEDHAERVDDGLLLNIKLSQNDFARLSMGSRQRVNAIFRDWVREGIIEYRDDYLLIKRVKGLMDEIVPFD